MKANILFKALTIGCSVLVTTGFITSCNKKDSGSTPTPPSPTPVGPDPEPEPTTETPEQYIKDRTFAISGFDESGKGTSAGTGWVLSDATPTVTTDYNYYIATNWHVKYAIKDKDQSAKLGYWFDGIGQNEYMPFITWTWESDENKFCFTANDKKTAIDFYVLKVNFGTATDLQSYPTIKAKLDNLNSKQASKGYINKFLQSSFNTNYATNKFYCGGYPVKNSKQTWTFESMNGSFTTYLEKDDATHKHGIDSDTVASANIVDISPQYQTNSDNLIATDEVSPYTPIGWGLIGGSSGSMLITSHNDEWVVAGIYWGGITYLISDKHMFSPCWSVINSDHKNFVLEFIK